MKLIYQLYLNVFVQPSLGFFVQIMPYFLDLNRNFTDNTRCQVIFITYDNYIHRDPLLIARICSLAFLTLNVTPDCQGNLNNCLSFITILVQLLCLNYSHDIKLGGPICDVTFQVIMKYFLPVNSYFILTLNTELHYIDPFLNRLKDHLSFLYVRDL